MSDRGMKKWAPYKSLVEQYDSLDKTRFQKEIIPQPILTSDKEEEINEILVNYHNQIVLIKYYRKDRIQEIETKIKKIDVNEKKLVLINNTSIKLNELVDIKSLD